MGTGQLEVVQAAYRVGCNEERWLRGLVEAALPSLPRGVGAFGLSYEVSSMRVKTRRLELFGLDKRHRAACCPTNELPPSMNGEIAQALIDSTTCGTNSTAWAPRVYETWLNRCAKRVGVRDAFSVVAGSRSGRGVVMGVLLPETAAVARRTAAQWEGVAGHIIAGDSMRQQLLRLGAARSDDGAGDSRLDALRNRVLGEADRESTTRRSSSALADIWGELANGRLSLIDQFDTEGRQYLVARKNDPALRKPRALTRREREVIRLVAIGYNDRLIAAQLGLSPSTVATHRARAMSKLGIKSRLLLAQVVRDAGSGGAPR